MTNPNNDSASESDTRPTHQIVYEVLSAPVSISCPNCKQQHTLLLPFRHRTESYAEILNADDVESQSSYTGWNVTSDPSVHLELDELPFATESCTGAIELQSRILDFGAGRPCPHKQILPCTGKPLIWNWRDEITTILTVLKREFTKPGYRVLTNRTTGLHVHIGRNALGFPLSTTKNILATFVAFERVFDTIVPCSRISGYDDASLPLPGFSTQGFTYAYPSSSNHVYLSDPHFTYVSAHSTRFFSILAATLQPLLESAIPDPETDRLLRCLNVPSWITMIYEAQILPQLREFGEVHRSVVNLQHLPDPEGSPAHGKNTVEFRGHAGSLHPDEILAWMDFLGCMVHWCRNSSAAATFAFLKAKWAHPRFSIVQLAEKVGVADTTTAYYRDLSTRSTEKYSTAVSVSDNPLDELHTLTRVVALHGLKDSHPTAVTAKIEHKLVSGRYGQLPISFFQDEMNDAEMKALFSAAEFLCMEVCDWEGWRRTVEAWMLDDGRRFGGAGGRDEGEGFGYSDLA